VIHIVNQTDDLKKLITQNKRKNIKIGFVPTMGALHEGHLSLVRKCCMENDLCIVSVFINPTQFNDASDFEKYPVQHENDIEKLLTTKAHILFLPDVTEIYPEGIHGLKPIDLGGLDQEMEGALRPGHFQGVAQVMKRLLEAVTPDNLYMGQKDYQQVTIIKYLIKKWELPLNLVMYPIVREKGGLAMSSRNVRLSPDVRIQSGIIYKTLKYIKRLSKSKAPEYLTQYAARKLSTPPFHLEYAVIADKDSLKPLTGNAPVYNAVCCVAVNVENVRLIDNILL
jgi:pantoate--beta-alanine ligase